VEAGLINEPDIEFPKYTTREKEHIKEYMTLVPWVASKYYNGPDQHEDLMSVGYRGLTVALYKWNEFMDIKFSTYAVTCIRNEIIDHMRKRKHRSIMNNMGDLMEMLLVDYNNSERQLLSKELSAQAERVLSDVTGKLNEREMYVLYEHILAEDAEPMRSIALQFTCSAMAIHRDTIRILNLLKEGGVDI
jgi:RNA polymerase sporulation-specific sigma factor